MKSLYLSLMLSMAATVSQAATIADTDRYSYGANIGWLDWNSGGSNAVIAGSVCSGWIYSANCGWIHLGNGMPTNGLQYANASADDFGVNCDAQGNLRGFAYSANIGWINFEDSGAPRIDLSAGRLSGSLYGANVGWISLRPGPALRLVQSASGTVLTWTSNPSGNYIIQTRQTMQPGSPWVDFPLGLIAGDEGPTTTATIPQPAPGQGYFRIKAVGITPLNE